MTAAAKPTATTPPRVLIRAFWTIHRAIVRISGGRIGLARPTAGKRFGMMRLTTIGRRSGQPRVAMVGYFEDGPNLVTMAMNGWADAEPAWWLNLQARPETTVELPGGRRAVRARAATGEERTRLWAMFGDYPGWGQDIDALAARRSESTAVVVLEPRSGQREGGGEAATLSPGRPTDGDLVARTAPVNERGARRLRLRHLWVVPGLAIAVYANVQAGEHGLGLAPLLAFGILPHLAVLVGVGQPRGTGQLAPRAVPLFNVMHHPVTPLAVLAVAATGLVSPFWSVAALAWLSHIVIDWALGDGQRTADGHLRRGAAVLVGGRAS